MFAPIHGKNTKQFTDFINRVLEMEKEEGKKFDGFGISTPIKPAERVLAVKAVRNTLEQHDDTRPIHALGAGAVKDIIPLVYAGVDMFDNVTSWRRATDGSGGSAANVDNTNALGSFSSFLIPLVNRNGDIITTNQKNVLGYVKLNKINTNYSCDCDICNLCIEILPTNSQQFALGTTFWGGVAPKMCSHFMSFQYFVIWFLQNASHGPIINQIEE